MKFDLEFHRIY